jgi:hypothetical protein
MHGAVAADRHHVTGSLARRVGRELLAVAWALRVYHLDGPSLRPKRPCYRVLRPAPCATTRRWIDDEMSLEHAASRYNSPAL